MGSLFGSEQTQGLRLPPELVQQLGQAQQGLISSTKGVQGAADKASGQVFTGFQGFQPSLNTNFAGPQFQQGLDPRAQAIVSQGTQGLQQQAGAQSRQIGRQVGGGAGRILSQQARSQARLQSNPLLFQAAGDQRAREAQQFQLTQQAQQMSNQAQLAQAQQNAQLAQLGNQGLLQQFGLSQAPLQAQQSLLQTLGQLAPALGTQFQKKGGLFG